jgi:hypothetical protein
MQKNDLLWKSILEDVFEDFLTFFYPESAQIFDFAIESKLKGDEFTLQF